MSLYSLLLVACCCSADVEAEVYAVGVAKVDITPIEPVRLHGFGFRRTPSEGIQQKLWAKAIAIGDKDPVVLITVDSLGVPASMTKALAAKLAPLDVKPDRLSIAATHTHTAPMLTGVAPTIFGMPIPKDHQDAIDRYTMKFADGLEQAARKALESRKPSKLYWGIGTAKFAANRRTKGGPVDHDLPSLFVKDETGKITCVLVNYACHCVTLSFNKVSGDWAGCACESIETAFPGAVGMVAIGCGADANPSSGVTGDKWGVAEVQGREIAGEVRRLADNFLAPISGTLDSASESITLPLATLPGESNWKQLAERKDAIGYHAKVQLDRLQRSQALKKSIDYEIRTWKFGAAFAMVFLPGEVVVDYSLRLKRELDGRRLWINAYSNDAPCYIPSERILKEGGYEGGGAMVYYDVPTKFATGLEDKIVSVVIKQAGSRFDSPHEANRTQTQPRSAQQTHASISVAEDLAVDLVAAEPVTIDPCAIAFGPDGKLWVAEINDYPSGAKAGEPGGRIRFLEDINGDGLFDRATTFLRGIPYPTGVTVWRKGVLVCAAPDILYAEDTNGDGKADVVKKLFTGFATHNYHARVNSLEYGLDGWIHGSCGLIGGNIKSSNGKLVPLAGRDFRCNPDTGEIEADIGNSQQGRVRSDWGDWFGCDNTLLGGHYPIPRSALGRNRHFPSPRNQVRLPDESAARIYPKGELQMFTLSGPVGQATAACGIGIYRDRLLGDSYTGDFFTCEPVHLCVHRMKLEPKGTTFVGRKSSDEPSREFFASSDPWCRPVQARTGPDGALWIVDMQRYVIEHPMWIPPEEHKLHDMRAGGTLGRIYRVRPKSQPLKAWPRLDRMSPAELVAVLESPNGTLRDLAMSMLLWKGDKSHTEAIKKIALESSRPECKVQAMATLVCMLGALDDEVFEKAIGNPHEGVRRFAVSTPLPAAAMPDQSNRRRLILDATNDKDAQVRMAAAVAIRNFPPAESAPRLARLALDPKSDDFLRFAVASSFTKENIGLVLKEVCGGAPNSEFVNRLTRNAVAVGAVDDLGFLPSQDTTPPPWRYSAVEGFLTGMTQKKALLIGDKVPKGVLEEIDRAYELAVDANRPPEHRAAAIGLFGWLPNKVEREVATISKLVDQTQPNVVQSAAVKAADRMRTKPAYLAVVSQWQSSGPSLRAQILDALVSHPNGQQILLDAISKKTIAIGDVDAARRSRLIQSSDQNVRTAAESAFAVSSADRAKVIAQYRDVPNRSGDASHGKQVFLKNCSACHRLKNDGHSVGPDLTTVALKPPSYLLAEILDPNRNLDARYIGYNVVLQSGQTLVGLMTGETPTSVNLSSQDGKLHALLRTDIEKISGSGKSLMPEGLEQQIPPADMADLLAYLAGHLPPPKSFLGNTPTVVNRQPDGSYFLPARFAELRGPSIQFELPGYNLGYWDSIEDRATWQIDIANGGAFDVMIEYSCPSDCGGNKFILDGVDPMLEHTIAPTGSWQQFQKKVIGRVSLAAGKRSLTIRPIGATMKGALMDLRGMTLTPAK